MKYIIGYDDFYHHILFFIPAEKWGIGANRAFEDC